MAKGLALWLIVVAVLAVANRHLLFVQAWHEHSDYAVDALKIERARHFREILGNYSRFDFCHPGPAFYYVYAAGEEIFLRGLHLVPSPFNAHMLAGLGLQAFFFVAALIMAAEWIRRPLFLPLALAACAIHFALAERAFVDIWPPRVLLMPFFCFVVGAASVAAGRMRDAPWMVLAGCFLVHGHVAQPLYVAPMALLAVGAAAWGQRREPGGWRRWRREQRGVLVGSAAIIALFLVPMALDLAAGADSNLAKILEFQRGYPGPAKPLGKALVYFAGYFGYVKRPELFLKEFGPDRAALIGERAVAYFAWVAILGVALAHVWRIRRQRAAGERPFVLGMALFTAVAFLLSLQWGRAQIGSVFEYGGYFFYAIDAAILLLACAAISTRALPRPGWIGAGLVAVAVVFFWRGRPSPSALDVSNNQIPGLVARALAADPQPTAPKYLVFNRGDWGEALSVGLALRRTGHDFRVDAAWGPKFEADGGFEPAAPDFDFGRFSVWRLSHLGPTDRGVPMRDNMRFYFAPLPLDPASAVIDGAENGNLELYTLIGFESPLDGAAWTIRPHALLEFASPPVAADVQITFEAEPYVGPGRPPGQEMILRVNGREVGTSLLMSRGRATIRVPAEVWNAKQPVRLALHFPAVVEQRLFGRPLDRRQFGWHIRKILFEVAR